MRKAMIIKMLNCKPCHIIITQLDTDMSGAPKKPLLAHTGQSHQYRPFCVEIWLGLVAGVARVLRGSCYTTLRSQDSHPDVMSR